MDNLEGQLKVSIDAIVGILTHRNTTFCINFTGFVLVEFTEDGEFEIYTEDKVKKTGLGLFLAPYGPHKVDYPCRIIQLSSKLLFTNNNIKSI